MARRRNWNSLADWQIRRYLQDTVHCPSCGGQLYFEPPGMLTTRISRCGNCDRWWLDIAAADDLGAPRVVRVCEMLRGNAPEWFA